MGSVSGVINLVQQKLKMSSTEFVNSIVNEIVFKIVEEKNDFLRDDAISERSDSMYSYPESSKDDQVIPGYFNQNLSNQEMAKFGIEDCANEEIGDVTDEINFYGDESKKIIDNKILEKLTQEFYGGSKKSENLDDEIETVGDDSEKTSKHLIEAKENNFEELIVSSDVIKGMPLMSGDGN